ncbi:MAG: hypothetical protein ACLTDM_21050 [Clostridium butyricum]
MNDLQFRINEVEMIENERNRKAIVIREKDTFRFMDTDDKHINKTTLNLRSRLSGGDIRYYEMDVTEGALKGMPPNAFIQVLNTYPNIADKSDLLKEI